MANKRRILVLDDDEGIRKIVSRTLSSCGFEVITVATGEEVLEKIRNGEVFDCAILDVTNYGGMGAISTMKELQILAPDLSQKVIVMSDGTHSEVREPGRFGYAGALEKPFNPQQLLDVLNLVLSKEDKKTKE